MSVFTDAEIATEFRVTARTIRSARIRFGLLRAASAPTHDTRERAHLLVEIREGLGFTFGIPWLWITIFLFAIVNVGVYGPLAIGIGVWMHLQRVNR